MTATWTTVTPRDPQWPGRLREQIPDLERLAVRGRLPADNRPAVAIVGQRRATTYGREIASWLADACARSGVTVVSGGALGIDAAAHRATADVGGAGIVVLGCGPDLPYPRQHARSGGLFDHVVAQGGALVSQWKGRDEPWAARVLARNRTIAALSDAVVVVEGGARSGALNTATHAAELGISVLAVPGDVRAPGSAAPNHLLAEGCAPCREPDDLLAAVGARLDLLGTVQLPAPGSSVLPAPVLEALAGAFPRPVALDDLAAATGLGVGSLLAVLTRARIAGEVTTEAGAVRLRRAVS